jgi:hypothetical protein
VGHHTTLDAAREGVDRGPSAPLAAGGALDRARIEIDGRAPAFID